MKLIEKNEMKLRDFSLGDLEASNLAHSDMALARFLRVGDVRGAKALCASTAVNFTELNKRDVVAAAKCAPKSFPALVHTFADIDGKAHVRKCLSETVLADTCFTLSAAHLAMGSIVGVQALTYPGEPWSLFLLAGSVANVALFGDGIAFSA